MGQRIPNTSIFVPKGRFDQFVEATALKIAVANNGGGWATHYTEDQKDVWRQRAREHIFSVGEFLVEFI